MVSINLLKYINFISVISHHVLYLFCPCTIKGCLRKPIMLTDLTLYS